jgi:hypothetical protein
MKPPAWLLTCHPNSLLNAREFAAILGISQTGFSARLRRGDIPPPTYNADHDYHRSAPRTRFRLGRRVWSVGYLLNNFFEREK